MSTRPRIKTAARRIRRGARGPAAVVHTAEGARAWGAPCPPQSFTRSRSRAVVHAAGRRAVGGGAPFGGSGGHGGGRAHGARPAPRAGGCHEKLPAHLCAGSHKKLKKSCLSNKKNITMLSPYTIPKNILGSSLSSFLPFRPFYPCKYLE